MRRPINPVIPYPHEAIQHTRCVLALSMITVAISFLKPEPLALLGDLGKQVEKVNRWSERCADDTQKRRLSAGAKRDLDARFHILAGHVGDVQAAAGDASRWTQWGAGMWAGLTFLEDCRNTCPAYFRGLHWHNLLKTLITLCNALENVDPQIAEIGTRVYERTA
ncbi:hypothetical protein [Bilophila wadsworthia]|uniref:hypothetical protein n=1 Tax=Bilophila wadsworthia TaxID=35833 RepID=UPI0027B9CA3B|nr:hypothetical protein [Bilophila wadsworthia]MDU4375428.1 hypothetical protein [Bilophila wadsworthia]